MDPVLELVEYICGSCHEKSWQLYIGNEEGKTYLIVVCSNKECVEKRREELGITDNTEMVIWSKFDITTQCEDLLPSPIDSSIN